MNSRRRRRMLLVIRYQWVDALIVIVLLATVVGAIIRWPEKLVADIAFPIAIVIAFMVWRER
jgi:hypothetical protein